MANFCRNCNAQLPDNAPFCNSCGAPVQQGQQFPQQGPAPGQQFQQQGPAPGQQFPQQEAIPQQQFPQQEPAPQQQFPQQGPVPGQQFPQQEAIPQQQFPQQEPAPGQQFPQQGPVPQQQFPTQDQQFPPQGPAPQQQFPLQDQQFPQQGQQYPQQGPAPQQQFPPQDQQFPPQDQQFPQQGPAPQQQFPPQDQQFPQQGQQYPQQGPPVPPQPKKILGLTTKQLMIIGGAAAVVIIGVILLIVLLGGNSYESLEYFDVGGDMIPSVFYVLGEKRSISSVDTSSSKKSEKMVIQYSVDKKQGDDMEEYAQALVDDYDFIAMDEYDFSGKSGKKFEFVKVSDEDDDFIVSVSIDFDSKGYKLTITRQEGTTDTNISGGPDDPDKPGDDNTNSPYDVPPLTENDVDLIVSKYLAGGNTLDEVRANAPDGVAVVDQNPDGSYIFRMSKDRQQELLEVSKQMAEIILDSIWDFDGVVMVAWDPEGFSACSVIAEQAFYEADNNVNYSLAIMIIAQAAPLVQVYMGFGLDSITSIELVNVDTDESKVITSEEFLAELFG